MGNRYFGDTKDCIGHTLPLRQDPLLMAYLVLPKDLSQIEAHRVCEFVKALAVPA